MYETVFAISWPGSEFGILCVCSIGGFLGLFGGISVSKKRKGCFINLSQKTNLIVHNVIFCVFTFLILMGICAYLFFSYKLVNHYKNGDYEIAEGEVLVLHQQRQGGHDKGDKVLIDGTKFVIDYFTPTNAYNQTIAYGGVLHNGVQAKLYHHDGKILRIDILKTENGADIPQDVD